MKCICTTKRHLEAIPSQGMDEQIRHNYNEADTCSRGSPCCKITVLEGFTSVANQHTRCVVSRRPVKPGYKTTTRSLQVGFLFMFKTYAPKGVRLCNEHIGNSNLKSGFEL